MTRTRWIIFAVICLSVLGLVIVTNKKSTDSSYKGDATQVITQGPIADHVFGSNQNKVILVEYGDYECPGCEAAYPIIKQVTNSYKNQLTFVFRNLPLTTIHPNALAAATAAEAAGLQGRYYEYHDLLYDNQSSWNQASLSDRTSLFEGYAKQLGLDLNKFRNDLTSSQVGDKINRDRSTAASLGFNSTPSLMLDGAKLSQDTTFSQTKLAQAVSDELKKMGITPAPAN